MNLAERMAATRVVLMVEKMVQRKYLEFHLVVCLEFHLVVPRLMAV